MATQAQVLANRRNAAKSTGPRTPEGKAVVAQNAVKHGLLARQGVLKDEDPQEFELHRTRMLQSLDPDGPEQEMLAERIVGLWWRLKRAERMQDEALDYLIEADRGSDWVKHLRSQGDPSAGVELTFGRAVARDFADARTLDRLSAHERRIESSLYRTMKELRQVQLARESGTPVETQHLASPHRIAADEACCAKQSQSEAEGDGHNPPEQAGAVPVEAFAETQDVASLQEGVVAGDTECAKQTQSAAEVSSLKCDVSSEAEPAPKDGPSCETKPMEAAGSVCSVPAGASQETPGGVTTNGDGDAKQSQSVTVEGGHSRPSETACAKQSQCRKPAAAAKTMLRRRPRVAYHSHNIVRSY